MSYEEWVEKWQLQILNEHLLEVYGEEDAYEEIFEEDQYENTTRQ